MTLHAEAALVAAFVRVAIRVLPLPTLVAWLDRRRSRAAGTPDVGSCLAAAASAASRVAHPTCLYRSLIAFALLTRRGVAVTFHLGASAGDIFGAHAWLSLDGRVLDDEAARWPPLWQYASAAARH